MPMLYATCGLAFSGKTTLARRLAGRLGIDRVSLDVINTERGLDGGQGMTDAQWEETSFIALERIGEILSSSHSVVLDDTLSHRFLRDRYRKAAADSGAEFVLLFLDTPIVEIERRIQQNRRRKERLHIQPEVFEVHRDRFQYPTEDERPVRFASVSEADCWLAALVPEAD